MHEDRPPPVVARDLMLLHGTLVSALHDEMPDGGPPPPGGAADLGRLTFQILDGSNGWAAAVAADPSSTARVPAAAREKRGRVIDPR